MTEKLDTVLRELSYEDAETIRAIVDRLAQEHARLRAAGLGEFFPAQFPEGASGATFLDFFQTDKDTGASKGIIALNLEEWS